MARKTKKQKLLSQHRKQPVQPPVVDQTPSTEAVTTNISSQYVIKEPDKQPEVTIPKRQFQTRGFTKEQDLETRAYFMKDFRRSSLVILGIIIVETAIYFLAQSGYVSRFFPY